MRSLTNMKWGLNLKFICYTVFIVVFISLVFSVVFIFQSRKALLAEFRTRAESLVKNLALNIEVPLLIENMPQLRLLAQNLMEEKDVRKVNIFDAAGTLLLTLDKGAWLFPWQEEKIICPVIFSAEPGDGVTEDMTPFFQADRAPERSRSADRIIGTIEVVFSRAGIMHTVNRMRWWILVAATVAAFIGGLAALYFSHSLIIPIQRLAQAVSSIARGNWQERLQITGTDELGQLTESFNMMAASLQAKKEQLEHTYRELARKEKMADIGKFSMIIAHELKNPLGIIKGSVDILQKPATQPHIRQTMMEYIQDEVKRLNKLIEDFLAFARPAPPQKMPADVNAIVNRVAEHFNIQLESAGDIVLQTELSDCPPVALDEHQIYQALLNLVTNAVQAIGDKGTIHIRTEHREGIVCIRVSNTGAPIPAELREKLFEPFYTTKASGTGLGLAIVKKLIESHQGSVSIADFDGGGTTFEIVLPLLHG